MAVLLHGCRCCRACTAAPGHSRFIGRLGSASSASVQRIIAYLAGKRWGKLARVAAVSVSACCGALLVGMGVLARLPPSSSCRAPACSSASAAAEAARPAGCARPPPPLAPRPKWRRNANQLAPMRRRNVSGRCPRLLVPLPPPSTSAPGLLTLASALHTGHTGRRLPSPAGQARALAAS